jgi:hypothetical protein
LQGGGWFEWVNFSDVPAKKTVKEEKNTKNEYSIGRFIVYLQRGGRYGYS